MSGPVSKIATLPAAIREELNARLLNGEMGSGILAWLNSLPEVQRILDERWGEQPVSQQNLSEWRKGEYQTWLDRRDKIDALKILADHARKMAEAAGGSISEGAAAVAGGRILELLEAAEGEDLVNLGIALAKLRDADAKLLNARVNQENLKAKDRALNLAEAKFQRETAQLFLKWYADKRAVEIAEGKSAKTVKMDRLVQLMFGSRPDPAEDGITTAANAAEDTPDEEVQ